MVTSEGHLTWGWRVVVGMLVALILMGILMGTSVLGVIQLEQTPFRFDEDLVAVIPDVVCPGEPLRIRIVGESSAFAIDTVEISHAIEDRAGRSVYWPGMPNVLRGPGGVLLSGTEFDYAFNTDDFYRATIGEFPVLEPGLYNYRHQVEVVGFEPVEFAVPFEVVICDD